MKEDKWVKQYMTMNKDSRKARGKLRKTWVELLTEGFRLKGRNRKNARNCEREGCHQVKQG